MRVARSNSYISTSDVERIGNTTRSKLKEFVKKGVLDPFGLSSAKNSNKYWTLSQARIASDISSLKLDGVTLNDMAKLMSEGHGTLCEKVAVSSIVEMRQARRVAKAALRNLRVLQDTAHLVGISNYYLRYIPQRFLAITPISEKAELPGGKEHHHVFVNLTRVAMAAGWCHTGIAGYIESFMEDMTSSTIYAYIELAAMPQPKPTPDTDLDSGCYHAFSGCRLDECVGSCETCLRAGVDPSPEDRFVWDSWNRTVTNHDRIVRLSDLEQPYRTGAWSSFTRTSCDDTDGCHLDIGDMCSVLPRIMPQEVLLPFDTTACVIPPAIFLCCQFDEESYPSASERIATFTNLLERKRIDPEQETQLHDRLMAAMSPPLEKIEAGPDGVGQPLEIGFETMKGWSREISSGDLLQLTLPVGTAIAPEDGYCVICTELPPRMTNDEPRYEAQIIMYAPELMLLATTT